MPDNILTAEPPIAVVRRNSTGSHSEPPHPDYSRLEGWSDPSPTVGIPLAGSTRLVDVKMPAAEKFDNEPTANLLVRALMSTKRQHHSSREQKEFRRGSVANMVEDAKYLGEGWIDTWEKFKFVTGMTLLDIQGGKKLAKDYTSPGRVLLMGPAGELYVRNEVNDKQAVEYHDFVYDPDDKRRNQDAYGPEGPGGFGRPRGGARATLAANRREGNDCLARHATFTTKSRVSSLPMARDFSCTPCTIACAHSFSPVIAKAALTRPISPSNFPLLICQGPTATRLFTNFD